MCMLAEQAEDLCKKWIRQGRALPEDIKTTETIMTNATEQIDLNNTSAFHKKGEFIFKKHEDPYTFHLPGEIYRRRGPFKFFELPFEVREIVLEEIIGQPTIKVFLRGNWYSNPTFIPMVRQITAYGNHQLRVEGLLVTLKNATWELHSFQGNQKFQAWLDTLDFTDAQGSGITTGYEAIHHLKFPYFSRFPHATLPSDEPNGDVLFMRKCANLRSVNTTWMVVELWDKTVDQLRQEYRLDGMLELDELKELCFHGTPLIEPLAKWFKEEFQKKSQAVVVKVNGDPQ